MKKILTIVACLFCFTLSAKQNDSLFVANNRPKKQSEYPVLGLWKQNYIATGFATNAPVSKYTSDVKFQLSIALRLWHIGDNVDLFASYTQHSVWDIYQESCPFRETAYNPGFWVAWRVTPQVRTLFAIEHESNGEKEELSRSFNYITAACLYEPHLNWRLGARAWFGYYDRKTIERYFHYRGIMQVWGTFHTRDERFSVTALVNPTLTFARYNVQMEASWRMAKRGDWLPALFVQYSYGYGETMIDYNRRASKIRLGISLTNNKINLY